MAQIHLDSSLFAAPASETNPFRRRAAALPEPLSEEDTTFALVQSGPAVDPSECERFDVSEVEITVRWGDNILNVAHVATNKGYRIGEVGADFVVPAELLGGQSFELVRAHGAAPTLCVPAGAKVSAAGSSEVITLDASRSLPLTAGACFVVTLGELSLRVASVNAGKPTARKLAAADSKILGFFGLTALTAGMLMGALAYFVPSMGLLADEGADSDRLYAIQQYLQSAAERERDRQETPANEDDAREGSSEVAEGAKAESGKMGKVGAPVTNRRSSVKGPKDNTDTHLAREAALRDAKSFGIIGLLNDGSGSMAQTVPWGRDTSLGTDDADAQGNMWGDELGESGGSGGLSLTGIGSGGGQRGESIGMGGIGTCGSAFCPGLEHGFGSSTARPGMSYKPKTPIMRAGATTVSQGSLPAEVVQRIVRQNYGRFRMCYEGGLRGNPNLAGRVAVRFVINRDGAVTHATNAGSDLPDSGVVGCVVGAYYGLSFPAPKDGIVTVNYPIQFSPG